MGATTPRSEVRADLGDGALVRYPTSRWSITRTLTGGGLPGQVRTRTGFAAATGSAEILVADSRTPWKGAAIEPGELVTIAAANDADEPLRSRGRMFSREISADGALTRARTLDLVDDWAGLKNDVSIPLQLGWGFAPDAKALDASYLIDAVVRANGYFSAPPAMPGCALSAPFQGSTGAAVGAERLGGATLYPEFKVARIGRDTPAQVQGMVGFLASYHLAAPVSTRGARLLLAFTREQVRQNVSSGGVWGEAFFIGLLPGESFVTAVEVRFSGDRVRVEFWGPGWASRAFVDFDLPPRSDGKTPLWASDVAQRIVLDLDGTGTHWRFRVRYWEADFGLSPWTAWQTTPIKAAEWDVVLNDLQVMNSAELDPGPWYTQDLVAGVQLAVPPPGMLEQGALDYLTHVPTARIDPTGSMLTAALASSSSRAQDVIAGVAKATMGAAWFDEDGLFISREKHALRGAFVPAETIVSTKSLADLPWAKHMEDVAARVEVTYRPVEVSRYPDVPPQPVWSATEAIRLEPGKSVTTNVALTDVAVTKISNWVAQIGGNTYGQSEWAAAYSPDGSGVAPPADALSITHEIVTPSLVRLTIQNTTSSRLWTVNSSGTPHLHMRAWESVRAGEPLTVAEGVPADQSRTTLAIDCGAYVQDERTALEILSWLRGMTAKPLPVLRRVRAVPSTSRRLGDVARLVCPFTGIDAKVLIFGIHEATTRGEYRQELDLAVLEPVVFDLDQLWAGKTVGDFDAFWAGKTVGDFDDDPLAHP